VAETTVLRSPGIIRNASPNATSSRPNATLSGALPVVNVNMNAGGPQRQGGQQVRQGVTILPPKAGTLNFRTGGLPNQPAKQSVVILPPKEQRAGAGVSSPLTADQLLLCRHLADKYLGEVRASADEAQADGTVADNIKLAESTVVSIDAAMVAMTAAAAIAAAPTPPPQQRSQVAQRSTQVAASATPRRVVRPSPLPPVIVKMDDGQPAVVEAESTPSLDQLESDAQS
jgi:hypothetical protein